MIPIKNHFAGPSNDKERNWIISTSVINNCNATVTRAIPVIIPPWIIAAIMNLFPHLVLKFLSLLLFIVFIAFIFLISTNYSINLFIQTQYLTKKFFLMVLEVLN